MNGEKVGDKTKARNAAIGSLVAMLVGGWYLFGGGLEDQAASSMKRIEDRVAADAVVQYGIAKKAGTPMDRCVQAGLVAAAFLQAKDEANYVHWKPIETSDCAAAGAPK